MAQPAKRKGKNGGYYVPRPKFRVSKHDHVGNMIFIDLESAACRECGQIWDWVDGRGWVAQPYTGVNG